MQITFLKKFISRCKNFINLLQGTTIETSTSPLENSFNLYSKEDMKLALDMINHGYTPTKSQLNNISKLLTEEAKESSNFLYKYQSYIDHIPAEAIISFCIYHDLSIKCRNDITIFNNFEYIFKKFALEDNFSHKLYKEINYFINTNCSKALSIKPKYANIHAFEFNHQEQKTYNQFTNIIYNSLVLIPYMVQDLDQFVSLKNNIVDSIKKIENYLQSHNFRIIREDRTLHYNKENRQLFKMNLLHNWETFINEYDIKKLKEQLLNKIQSSTIDQQNTNSTSTNNTNTNTNIQNKTILHSNNEDLEILIDKLENHHRQHVDRIVELYNHITTDMFEKNHKHDKNNDIDSLYKDIYKVIDKYVSIHPEYRNTLKNIEGKSPEVLMVESLNIIESTFSLYWEDINQNKVTDLSIVGRSIKMKT